MDTEGNLIRLVKINEMPCKLYASCVSKFGEVGCEDWEQTLDNIRSDFIGYLPNVTYRKCQDIPLKFIG